MSRFKPALVYISFAIAFSVGVPHMRTAESSTAGRSSKRDLGIGIRALDPQMEQTFALKEGAPVFVESVAAGSEAERSGLKKFDIVISVNENIVAGTKHFTSILASLEQDVEVRFDIMRRGVRSTLVLSRLQRDVVIARRNALLKELEGARGAAIAAAEVARQADATAQATKDLLAKSAARMELLSQKRMSLNTLGLKVEDITPQLASILGRKSRDGLFVSLVVPDSPAHQAGVAVNDLIIAVNGMPVPSVQGFSEFLEKSSPLVELQLQIERAHKPKSAILTSRVARLFQEEKRAHAELQARSVQDDEGAKHGREDAAHRLAIVQGISEKIVKIDPSALPKGTTNIAKHIPTAGPAAPSVQAQSQQSHSTVSERSFEIGFRFTVGPSLVGGGIENGFHLTAYVPVENLLLFGGLQASAVPDVLRRFGIGVGVGWRQPISTNWSLMTATELSAGYLRVIDTTPHSSDFSVPTVRADISAINTGMLPSMRLRVGIGAQALLVTADGVEEVVGGPEFHLGILW